MAEVKRLMPAIRSAASGLLDLVYPRPCEGCGIGLGRHERAVCWNCIAALQTITPPYCRTCGNPVEGVVDHAYTCFRCSEKAPPFRYARSAVRYRDLGRTLVGRFKYNHALWLDPVLTDLLAAAYQGLPEQDGHWVCDVPLHAAKQKERGYNQARLLAASVARALDLPIVPAGTLTRVRRTRTQTNLTARERMSNVKGAFKSRHDRRIKGKHILLIDDVMTTGATVGEASRTLRRAGAASVDVVTVARGG